MLGAQELLVHPYCGMAQPRLRTQRVLEVKPQTSTASADGPELSALGTLCRSAQIKVHPSRHLSPATSRRHVKLSSIHSATLESGSETLNIT